MGLLTDEMVLQAYTLLSDKLYDDMNELAPFSLKWCDVTERFITVVRAIKKLEAQRG